MKNIYVTAILKKDVKALDPFLDTWRISPKDTEYEVTNLNFVEAKATLYNKKAKIPFEVDFEYIDLCTTIKADIQGQENENV